MKWLMRSPLRFYGTIGGAAGFVLLCALAMSALPSGTPDPQIIPADSSSSTPAVSASLPPGVDVEPTPSGPTATMDPASQEAASATAWSFVQAWLQGHGGVDQATWEKQVGQYAGGDALDGVHVMTRQARDQIPAVSLASVQVAAASPQGALVTANLSDGTQLSLTLAPINGRWLVTELGPQP